MKTQYAYRGRPVNLTTWVETRERWQKEFNSFISGAEIEKFLESVKPYVYIPIIQRLTIKNMSTSIDEPPSFDSSVKKVTAEIDSIEINIRYKEV